MPEKKPRYTYKDFVTGKTRFTRGSFVGWSERTGPLHVHYALFVTACTTISVPRYCVTLETLEKIGLPQEEDLDILKEAKGGYQQC